MFKSLWKDPVWAAVMATGITAALGALGTYLLGLWPTISAASMGTWHFLIATTPVSNWLLGLLILPALLVLSVIGAAVWSQLTEPSAAEASWLEYKTDKYFGLRWRWQYADGSIVQLVTFCPNCDFQIFPRNASSYSAIDRISFECESCHQTNGVFEESYDHLLSKVERSIQQKLRNGTWKPTN